jgi:hypothetical protein
LDNVIINIAIASAVVVVVSVIQVLSKKQQLMLPMLIL